MIIDRTELMMLVRLMMGSISMIIDRTDRIDHTRRRWGAHVIQLEVIDWIADQNIKSGVVEKLDIPDWIELFGRIDWIEHLVE